jgi:hypothetical protein
MAVIQIMASGGCSEALMAGLTAASTRALSACSILLKRFMEAEQNDLVNGEHPPTTLVGTPFVVSFHQPATWLPVCSLVRH